MTLLAKGNCRRETSNPSSNNEHIQRSIYSSHLFTFRSSIIPDPELTYFVDLGEYIYYSRYVSCLNTFENGNLRVLSPTWWIPLVKRVGFPFAIASGMSMIYIEAELLGSPWELSLSVYLYR